MEKTCKKCNKLKKLELFNKRGSGYRGTCKDCQNLYLRKRRLSPEVKLKERKTAKKYYNKVSEDPIRCQKRRERIYEHRKKKPELYKKIAINFKLKNPEKIKEYEKKKDKYKIASRKKLRAAVKKGALLRPDYCEECGCLCKPHGHHEDYSKPLDVQWLCLKCHRLKHIIYS